MAGRKSNGKNACFEDGEASRFGFRRIEAMVHHTFIYRHQPSSRLCTIDRGRDAIEPADHARYETYQRASLCLCQMAEITSIVTDPPTIVLLVNYCIFDIDYVRRQDWDVLSILIHVLLLLDCAGVMKQWEKR